MAATTLCTLPDDILLNILSTCDTGTALTLHQTCVQLRTIRPRPKSVPTNYTTASRSTILDGTWRPQGLRLTEWGVISDSNMNFHHAVSGGLLLERAKTNPAGPRTLSVTPFTKPEKSIPLNLPLQLYRTQQGHLLRLCPSTPNSKSIVGILISGHVTIWDAATLKGLYMWSNAVMSNAECCSTFLSEDLLFSFDAYASTVTAYRISPPNKGLRFTDLVDYSQPLQIFARQSQISSEGLSDRRMHVRGTTCVFLTESDLNLWNADGGRFVRKTIERWEKAQAFVGLMGVVVFRTDDASPTVALHRLKDLICVRNITLVNAFAPSLPPHGSTVFSPGGSRYQLVAMPRPTPTIHISSCLTRLYTVLHTEARTGSFKLSGRGPPQHAFNDKTILSTFFMFDLLTGCIQICQHERVFTIESADMERNWLWYVDRRRGGRKVEVMSFPGARQKVRGGGDGKDGEGADKGGDVDVVEGMEIEGGDMYGDLEFRRLFPEETRAEDGEEDEEEEEKKEVGGGATGVPDWWEDDDAFDALFEEWIKAKEGGGALRGGPAGGDGFWDDNDAFEAAFEAGLKGWEGGGGAASGEGFEGGLKGKGLDEGKESAGGVVRKQSAGGGPVGVGLSHDEFMDDYEFQKAFGAVGADGGGEGTKPAGGAGGAGDADGE
ncbi:hypothetical protein HDV00_012610 [Rhizophlyctis rosea]|nr:hypothetical protein HDV00_012610 [Rhizophlyctis rosea]